MSGFDMLLDADGRSMKWPNGTVALTLPNPAAFEIPTPPMSLASTSASATNSYHTSHSSISPDLRQALVNMNDVSANLNDASLYDSPVPDSQRTVTTSQTRPGRGRRRKSYKIENADPPASKQKQILAKNRQAANRYRLRQKDYVKNLERRCRTELDERRAKLLLVRSLEYQVSQLKNLLISQSSCNCAFMQSCMYPQESMFGPQSAFQLASNVPSEEE